MDAKDLLKREAEADQADEDEKSEPSPDDMVFEAPPAMPQRIRYGKAGQGS